MYIYVYIYICMNVFMHMCIRHLQTYVFVRHFICDLNMFNTHVYKTYVLMYACMHIYIYVRTYKAYKCVGMFASMCRYVTHTNVCIFI